MGEDKNIVSMISIGALSKAAGIPTETIRTWERRYGFPEPVRKDSGHRRYPIQTVERLRLIKQALDLGHKPSTVVPAEIAELQSLLALTAPESDPMVARPEGQVRAMKRSGGDKPIELPEDIARWMSLVIAFDGDALQRLMRREWNELGAVAFIQQRLSPFLRALGELWSQGQVQVMHEHFASERLREFLTSRWRPMSDEARGPKVICATLPGEQHVLGLHLVALMLAMADLSVLFLGADTPVPDITRAALVEGAAAVALSVSASSNPAEVRRDLSALRRALPATTAIVAGGQGAPRDVPDIEILEGFQALLSWGQALREDPTGRAFDKTSS